MTAKVDVLSVLRTGTWDLHKTLESVPVFARLTGTSVTRDDYIRALDALRHCYAMIEAPLIQGLQQYAPAYPYIARLPLLHQDLSQLGYSASSSLPLKSTRIPNLPETLGALYTIEGSTLGGKRLIRHLQTKLAAAILADAMAFYQLDGKIDAHNWATTQILLQERLITSDDIEQAMKSARRILLLFINAA